MRRDTGVRIVSFILTAIFSLGALSAQAADWNRVEQVLGRSGVVQGDMLKVSFPRTDLTVRVGEVTVSPGLALTSWLGFRRMSDQAMMMGDLVLLEKEVPVVMSRLEGQGISITALHNHLLNTAPVVMYMHIGGQGDPQRLAAAVMSALVLTATPMKSAPPAAPAVDNSKWAKVEQILGKEGQKKGNLLQLSFNRKQKARMGGMEVPPFLGVASPVNLQMVGDKAAATGDFVLTAGEVNPVIRALTDHHIAVTAIHNHMLFETPRLFFLHFWAYDEPTEVAAGLRAALDKMNLAK